MSLMGTIAAIRSNDSGNQEFWNDFSGRVKDLLTFTHAEDVAQAIVGSEVLRAVIVDGTGIPVEKFVQQTQAAERAVAQHDIPLICLASDSFRKPEAIRPDAILSQPVPVQTVLGQIRSLNRLKLKKTEAAVRVAALNDLGIEVPKPYMPVAGGNADNRPALLVVGTRGNFSQIESVLGAKVQFVAAMTADMANLYLGWRTFDAVVLDQENSEALDTLLLLRSNPIFHDLPIILLTEGLDAETTKQAYLARANDVMTLRSTRADLFLRLTTGIRTRRLDRQTQEMLLRSQDALEGTGGAIPAESFKRYLHHAKLAARTANRPLTVTRLAVESVGQDDPKVKALPLDKPALRLIRRLVRIEDLAMIVAGTGLITVFPGTSAANAELAISRIRGIMRTTPVTLQVGHKPLKLDATAKVAVVNTAA